MDNFFRETVRYYSTLGNIPHEKFFTEDDPEPLLVRDPLLDNILPGYSSPVDIMMYERKGRYAVSYSGRAEGIVKIFRDRDVCERTARDNRRKVKFYCANIARTAAPEICPGEAVRLGRDSFPEFAEFFRACNPGCETGDWLEDYFYSIADRGVCFGIFREGRLACVSDSPDMPVLSDRFAEIGINTLPGFRRQGLAADVCSAAVKSVISRGLVPLWSADSENVPSVALAEKTGFARIMNVTEISLGR